MRDSSRDDDFKKSVPWTAIFTAVIREVLFRRVALKSVI